MSHLPTQMHLKGFILILLVVIMKQTIPDVAKQRHNYTWCVEYGSKREETYRGQGYFFCHTCHLIDDKWDSGKKVQFQYPKWTCKAFHDLDSPNQPSYKKKILAIF